MGPLEYCPLAAGRAGCPAFAGGRPVDSGVLLTGMILHFVAFLIVVALLVWLIWRLLNAWGNRRPPISPLAELDLAYARGILTREDYFTRRADLVAGPASAGAVAPDAGPPAPAGPEPPGPAPDEA